ncbi:40S ribosomal protein S21 [Desmophyllum pertusum]|uniref:40S ribosomal protein S21 n=1 Tax=Desmophyllum pertusum TaxID=174260 RepID=A0A9W9YCK0_9CNID|nr:40S ribosomal protein S21 [Desmophyllum pertusum]
MQNEAGDYVDMYTPRKCSVTNRVIAAKDHASVQLNIGEIDDTGRFTGNFKTYALCGNLRQQGEGDDSLTKLCIRDDIINKNYDS